MFSFFGCRLIHRFFFSVFGQFFKLHFKNFSPVVIQKIMQIKELWDLLFSEASQNNDSPHNIHSMTLTGPYLEPDPSRTSGDPNIGLGRLHHINRLEKSGTRSPAKFLSIDSFTLRHKSLQYVLSQLEKLSSDPGLANDVIPRSESFSGLDLSGPVNLGILLSFFHFIRLFWNQILI